MSWQSMILVVECGFSGGPEGAGGGGGSENQSRNLQKPRPPAFAAFVATPTSAAVCSISILFLCLTAESYFASLRRPTACRRGPGNSGSSGTLTNPDAR